MKTYLLQILISDGDNYWETIKATCDQAKAYMHSIGSTHRVVSKETGRLVTTKELL